MQRSAIAIALILLFSTSAAPAEPRDSLSDYKCLEYHVIAACEDAIQGFPDNDAASRDHKQNFYWVKAIAYEEIAYTRALWAYQEALEFDPKNQRNLYLFKAMGEINFRLGEYVKAYWYLDTYLEKQPTDLAAEKLKEEAHKKYALIANVPLTHGVLPPRPSPFPKAWENFGAELAFGFLFKWLFIFGSVMVFSFMGTFVLIGRQRRQLYEVRYGQPSPKFWSPIARARARAVFALMTRP
jgi:hypothetical protein